MESTFDRLVQQLSSEERLLMLQAIDNLRILTEEPMHIESSEDSEKLAFNQEFIDLPFFTKLWIIFICLLSKRTRDEITEEILLKEVQRKFSKVAPGLIDFRYGLVLKGVKDYITQISLAVKIFYLPLLRALESSKAEFQAFLFKHEFEELHERLETEPNPVAIANKSPKASASEIKRQMHLIFNNIMEDFIPDKHLIMLQHITILRQLLALSRFPYKRILSLFPDTDQGKASLTKISDPLLELGDILLAFQFPPSLKLLKIVFAFNLQGSLSKDTKELEKNLRDCMNQADKNLEIIRNINRAIPWKILQKAVSRNLYYTPLPLDKGEDWYHIFKRFWNKRLDSRFNTWFDAERIKDMKRKLCILWSIEHIPIKSPYSSANFPSYIIPRFEITFASMRYFFLNIFDKQLYTALNLIMIDGKFYKKDNRTEFESAYNNFLTYSANIKAFELTLEPDNIHMEHIVDDIARQQQYHKLIENADRDCKNLANHILLDLKVISKILTGILKGTSSHTYDSLSNMTEIGGRGNITFQKHLEKTHKIITQSSEIMNDLFEIEETRTMD